MFTNRTSAVVAAVALAVAPLAAVGAPAASAQTTRAADTASSTGTGTAKVVPVRVTGDPADRFNLIVLGDGYTKADMAKFRTDVDKHLNVLWSIEPYKSYRSYINVYRIEIPSKVSGVSCDPKLSSPKRDTPLNMGFWGGCKAKSPQRLLTLDQKAAVGYADQVTGTSTKNRQLLSLANSTTYGGAGGTYATASGGNAMSALISPHEIGHSLGGLPDEYDYYQRGEPGGAYKGDEPTAPDLSLYTERQMRAGHKKWWRWLGERSESGGVIGRYEGGDYHATGIWRPSRHSIMRTLGYYYDQVGRERMTKAISGKVDIIQDATPTGTSVGADRVLWIETLHPVSHRLTVNWTVDGKVVRRAAGAHDLDLARLHLRHGEHTVTATVVDPTDFVRDPAIRSSRALTRTRSWKVDTTRKTRPTSTPPGFTTTTPTDQPVGADSVVYAETSHPATRTPRVTWTVDGRRVRPAHGGRDLNLARFHLRTGTHKVTATVHGAGGSKTRTWTVDAATPTTSYTVAEAAKKVRTAGGPHYYADDTFTLRLTPSDDRSGYVVSEFRVDGDGWFNYFGWPTDSDKPFRFTEKGTTIDGLVYGKLAAGTHTIEYRSIDAAGNYGTAKKFTVTLR